MPEAAGTIERALTQLMREHQLGEWRSESLVGELMRDYPLVRRCGIEHAAQRMRLAGMNPERAKSAALHLLAFELLGRVSYERVLELMAAHAPDGDALAICLGAARLRREAAEEVRSEEPGALRSRLTRLATSWLGTR